MSNRKFQLNNVFSLSIIWILAYGFFYCTFLPINLCKIVAWTIDLAFICYFIFYISTYSIHKYWYPIIFLIIWGIVALFTSYLFHDQSFDLSIRVILPWFHLCFCFVLLYYKVTESELYKAILCFCLIYVMMYLLATLYAPSILFDRSGGAEGEGNPLDLMRGWYRIKIVGDGFINLMLYWQLNIYILKKRKKNLFFAMLLFVMVMLSLSRQHMLIAFSLVLFFLFQNMKWYKKLAVSFAILLLYIYLLPYFEIFNSLIDLTTKQLNENNNGSDDIRLMAYKYYLNYNDNIFQDLFGNGIYHSESIWGRSIFKITQTKGYILADVGIVSYLFYYGYIGCFIIIYFFYSILSTKLDKGHQFIKYYTISVLLGSIFSHTFDMSLLQLSIIYYLIYIQKQYYMFKKCLISKITGLRCKNAVNMPTS